MVRIKNSGPRLKLAAGVKLEPGHNDVEPSLWRECLENKMTRVFLSSHLIQVVSGPVDESTESQSKHTVSTEPETPVAPEPTRAKDLVVAVKESEDIEYLHGLLEGEHRTTVQIAIHSRLEALKKAAVAGDGEY